MKIEYERRRYFRINDIVGLTYSALEGGEEFKTGIESEASMPMMELLAEVDQNFNQVTNVLWHEKPAIAQALGLLNRKISIIAAHAMQTEDQAIDSYEDQMVNISGCGMAFHSAESFPVDTALKISTVLKPSNIKLNFTAKVVGCEAGPEGLDQHFWIRVSLDNDNAGAQEQLIQHIVQKQCSQISASESQPTSKVF
ncbi:MAG: PilZ domain-containing protein [Halioglobus sp.]